GARGVAGGPAAEPAAAAGTVIRAVPADTPRSASRAGSVLGTPAYMAPEQACGEVERLDERADVFGLGAMLCAILTGAPPYVRGDAEAVLRKARRGELSDAFARLDACGADGELAAPPGPRPAPRPAARPPDAAPVA